MQNNNKTKSEDRSGSSMNERKRTVKVQAEITENKLQNRRNAKRSGRMQMGCSPIIRNMEAV